MTPRPPPDVLVAVVTWNSVDVLPSFLATLPSALAPATSELVVADNASTDGTVEVARALAPAARVVAMAANAGYAAAINAAVATGSRAPAILVCNPDIRLAPDAVPGLLDTLRTPGTGIAVPRLADAEGRLAHSLRREPTVTRALGEALVGGRRSGWLAPFGEVVRDPSRYGAPTVADWASGAVMLISRECWDIVGPWDESFFLYAEETDFALRARDAGFSLRLTPDARAIHIGGESHSSPDLWALLTLNRLRLYRSRHGRARTAAFRLALATNAGLRLVTGRPTHRRALRALVGSERRFRQRLAEDRGWPVADPRRPALLRRKGRFGCA